VKQELVGDVTQTVAKPSSEGAQLDVLPSAREFFPVRTNRGELVEVVQQGVAVIRERQRDEPRSSEPALNLTEYNCVT
jgi:hypothetical protein